MQDIRGFTPSPPRVAAIEKEPTPLVKPCFCAKHGQDLTPFAASNREISSVEQKQVYLYQ